MRAARPVASPPHPRQGVHSPYTAFARIYDRWCAELDPGRWGRYNVALARRHGFAGGRVLDLGCGTGLSTRPWARIAEAVTGVDRSTAMLRLARPRRSRARNIRYLKADITAPGLLRGETFGVVLANFDVVNYQTRERSLLHLFRNARRLLTPAGCFLFDAVTEHAYRWLLNGVPVVQRLPGGAVFLEGRYRKRPGLWHGEITVLLAQRDGHYRGAVERHDQRYYSPARLRTLLRAAGFARCQLYATFTFRPPGPRAERVTVVARP
ncbi:MAG: class I SAM-dependent DNA methyltransferase [Candidatus Methylomirabilales bacterium]